MKSFSRLRAIVLSVCALLLLSGCYSGNIEQYYSLPKANEEYLQLQGLIDNVLASGCEYAAPVGGSYRQNVLLLDIDQDEINEAFVFFRSGDQLLVQVFSQTDGVFECVLTLQNEGTAINSIDFADYNGDGQNDFTMVTEIAAGMKLATIYDLSGWRGTVLLSTECTELFSRDMNGDGRAELLALRNVNGGTYIADMYTFSAGREPQASSAALSAGISSLLRIRSVSLSDMVPALSVESRLDNGEIVTDLLLSRDGSLVNLTMNHTTGISETHRLTDRIFAQDINSDGVLDIPTPQQLYTLYGETYWSIAWYSYDSTGRATSVMTTYHSVEDGWYFVLPSGWDTGLTVRRDVVSEFESAVTLSRIAMDGNTRELLTIFTNTGDSGMERARLSDRFLLAEEGSTVYSASIYNNSTNESEVKVYFHIIYPEWDTGTV